MRLWLKLREIPEQLSIGKKLGSACREYLRSISRNKYFEVEEKRSHSLSNGPRLAINMNQAEEASMNPPYFSERELQ